MLPGIVLSSVIGLVAYTSQVAAHGMLYQPKPSWDGGPNVGWITMIDNYWDIGTGGDQVGKFKTMAKEKGMSVKDVVLDMVKDKKCGNTLENGEAQPIPSDGKAIWRGNQGGGFTHTGPCEIYIDDKMVLHSDDCEDEFPGGDVGSDKMSEMPVDYSSCKGNCMFTFYWLGFQNAGWQAYVNCVPLKGDGSSTQTQTQSSSTGDKGNDDKSTEAPSTENQSNQSNQSNESPESSSTGNEAPAASQASSTDNQSNQNNQDNQTPATEAPVTDTKCKAPARRLRKTA